MKARARPMLAIHVLVLAFGLWASPMEAQAPSEATPREAALALFTTLQKQDWKGLYFVCAFSEKVADALPPSPEAFAAGVRSGIGGGSNQERVDSVFNGMSDLAVGGADLRGDYATLPTSCTITLQGKKHAFTGTAHLIRRQPPGSGT